MPTLFSDTINSKLSSIHTTTFTSSVIQTTTTVEPFMTMALPILTASPTKPNKQGMSATTLTSLVSTQTVIPTTTVSNIQPTTKHSDVSQKTSFTVRVESTSAITKTTFIPTILRTPAYSVPSTNSLTTPAYFMSLSSSSSFVLATSVSASKFMPSESILPSKSTEHTQNESPHTAIANKTSASVYVPSETLSHATLKQTDSVIPTQESTLANSISMTTPGYFMPLSTSSSFVLATSVSASKFMPKTNSESIFLSKSSEPTQNVSPHTEIANKTSASVYVPSETLSHATLKQTDSVIPTQESTSANSISVTTPAYFMPLSTSSNFVLATPLSASKFMPKTNSESILPSKSSEHTQNVSPHTAIANKTSASVYVPSETLSHDSLERSDSVIPTPIKTESMEITHTTNSSMLISNITNTLTVSFQIVPTGASSSEDNTPILPIIVVSVLCLLVLFVLVSVNVIGFFFSRRNRLRNKPEVRAGYEPLIREPNPTGTELSLSEQNFIVNPIYQPLYSILGGTQGASSRGAVYGTPMFFNLYKDVNPDTLSPRITPDSEEEDEEEEEEVRFEDIQSRLINVESHDIHIEHRGRMPTPSLDVEDEDTHSANTYSLVHVRRAPAIPPKSSDLLQYLAHSSNLNIDVHTEPISPLDFTYGDSHNVEDSESDYVICGPIYPTTVSYEQYEEPKEITSESFKELSEVGLGQFGTVFLVATTTEGEKMTSTTLKQGSLIIAVVKKVKPNLSPFEQEAFEKEVEFLSQLRHQNVLRFLGVCYQDPAFIMMEYTEEGDVCQFLQRYSEIVSTNQPSNSYQISTCTLIYMASQIANAMQHCAAFKFVHRDLATRNCYAGKNFTVKVAAVGIHAQLYQSHYFQIRGKRLFPIRWMAPECFSGKFSEKSDVWAFGVTMWELFTLGNTVPYPYLSDDEVIQNARSREFNRFPSKPATCPQSVYEIMQQCWIIDFQQRPTFREINVMLQTNT